MSIRKLISNIISVQVSKNYADNKIKSLLQHSEIQKTADEIIGYW